MVRRTLLVVVVTVMWMGAGTASAFALEEPPPPFPATVVDTAANVRAEPSTDSNLYEVFRRGDGIHVVDVVRGEAPDGGTGLWYQLASGGYLYSRYAAPTVPGHGRWIDVDLSNLTATAMVGQEPLYTAEVVTGRDGWETPEGSFNVLRRVANETMDGATLGIPPGSGGYYYFPDVLYTQYFTEFGNALHYNYWGDDSEFGAARTSRGCVGMRLEDAAYLWKFAELGTVVSIHY